MRFACDTLFVLLLVACGPAVVEPTPAESPTAPSAEPTQWLPDGDFDRDSAARVIGRVDLRSCRTEGTLGSGHATITFRPDGTVASVVVDGGPAVGTPSASCIEQRFGTIRMRPYDPSRVKGTARGYDGQHIKVGKSFTLN